MADARMLLANRYQLQERLPAGGIAEEWRASDLPLGRPVAVRLLRPGHPVDVERFLAAARRAAQVFHPGIVQVHDYGQSVLDGIPFLVTEVVSGPSLAAVTQAGPLDPPWVLEVICQVASALEVAHAAGLVHQNINPQNLLLAPGGAVKLTDFARSDAGEPAAATPASDLYSLGMVARECLTGVPSLSAAPPETIPGRESPALTPLPAVVPAGVAELVADLTAADPRARPASAAAVAARSKDLLAAPMRADEPCRTVAPGPRCLTVRTAITATGLRLRYRTQVDLDNS